ncbi:tetratricopeptide repeat protein [Virgibacillus dakarensis]|uniref:TPR repeat-containing protein YsoA n=1 Tax=Lentibacillus populi TaxID=1827502 RepID=A0A9W5TUU0_9BACI|nr:MULTISPECIES: tetratricopeptide repeat protein [Bacillaceae]MTW84226.1 tetratricopeptide repeat protein [Virgibacillus dakarensis]GGB28022.1 TPR repeat-containing protein YsoA [Lentibacillus populi]
MKDNHNIILFPKWKTVLEEESLAALKEKRYEEALKKLNKLISYHVHNHEIMIGKLICLMELGYHDEAQDLCETLLVDKDQNYYQYLHIYLTLLFQTSQYELLMEQVDYELQTGKIPSPYKKQFEQLYNMSRNMHDQLQEEKTTKYINELLKAVETEDHTKQWFLIEKIRKIKAKPPLKFADPLLHNELIHPVIKTAIFQWLQEMNVSEQVAIHKLDLRLTTDPTKITKITEHGVVKQTKLLIGDLEQENPTLYLLLEKVFYRYAYVRYPIMPPSEDVTAIAEALTSVGKEYLNLSAENEMESEKVLHYKKEIKMCEALYLSVIDE